MRPIKNSLLIKPLPSDGISEGGIFIPDSFAARNQKALVVAAGPQSKFKKGEKVWNIKDAGDEILINGEQHFLIKDLHVLAFETN